MKKILYHLLLVSFSFFAFSCSSDDDVTTTNGTETAQKYSKIIQVSNEEGNTSLELRITSYDQAKLDAFLDSHEYILTKESIFKSSDVTALEQTFTDQSPIAIDFSSIENEIISDFPDGYLITLHEKTPSVRASLSGNVLSISLRKTVARSSYYYWNGYRYLAASSYIGWVGHPQNGRRTFKNTNFDGGIFTQWRVGY